RGRGGWREGAGEPASGEFVAALGEREVELVCGPAVQLGGPPGPGPAPPRQAAEGRFQQPLLDEFIEMERGEGTRDPQRSRRLVPAHVAAPAGDVEIKTPPDRFMQRRDGCNLALELGSVHGTNVPICC